MEIRSPGCTHFVLESVSADPPFLLDNRSDQALQYRQANIQGLPFFQLPAYSAAGFLWQVPARPEEGAEQAGNLLGSKKSDTEIHEVRCLLWPRDKPDQPGCVIARLCSREHHLSSVLNQKRLSDWKL